MTDPSSAVHPDDGTPGSENSPAGTTDVAGIGSRAEPGVAPPPAANQGKPEPIPPHGDRAEPDEVAGEPAGTPGDGASSDQASSSLEAEQHQVADAEPAPAKTTAGGSGATATPHATRSGGPGPSQGAVVGRQAAPDGEVGPV